MVKQKFISLWFVIAAWSIAIVTVVTNAWNGEGFLLANSLAVCLALLGLGFGVKELINDKNKSVFIRVVTLFFSISLIGLLSLWMYLVEAGV